MSGEFEISRELRFEAAHHLPHAPVEHKCRRLHGHSFVIEVTVGGELREPEGWIMDFAEIDSVLSPVRSELDHRLLNEVSGLANPTSEELARWIWKRVSPGLPPGVRLARVVVRETCQSAASYVE